jgi:hypothetical protein
MTDDDACALILTCQMALTYDSHFRGESAPLEIPSGLLRQALAHLAERLGAEGIANLRASFASYGLEFSDFFELHRGFGRTRPGRRRSRGRTD